MALCYSEVLQQVKTHATTETTEALANVEKEISDFWLPLQLHLSESRQFLTRRGLLGLGAHTVQEGDEIWILATADVPFILRPLATPGTYSFVGTCFILDHMNGETLSEEYGVVNRVEIL